MRFRPPILVLLAVFGFAGAITMVIQGSQEVKPAPPLSAPAEAPYKNFVAGAALVEPISENIVVGTQVSGLVAEVAVKSGDAVKAGDLLYRLDDRLAKAALATAEANAKTARAQADAAKAQVVRLRNAPRAEEVAPRKAALAVAEAQLADAKDQLATLLAVTDPRAVQRVDVDRKRFAAATAEAVFAQAKSELALAAAGAWAEDLAVARAEADVASAQAAAAEAQAADLRVRLDLLRVVSPVDGRVLRVNLRRGEFAPLLISPPSDASSASLVVGDTSRLRVRVDVDENDAWKVAEAFAKGGLKARAFARGNGAIAVDLDLVRVEPMVVPKKNLTGESTERVDTRVLQVIFSFVPDPRLYVGQQMDVYIETK